MNATFETRVARSVKTRKPYALRDTDLSGVDLLGADFRDARIDGADLSLALYLTQPQLNAASGNQRTLLPTDLEMPSHWNKG
ncbi:MAG: pentapeptide repeat-containing protein [Acidobacteria bacterium]|nr:pentapeptide repeat-containing protein [Acidobacteriota bacterium]